MIVISDTTPIIALMKASQLNLLDILFSNILIPRAVFEELVSIISFKDGVKLEKLLTCPEGGKYDE